MKSYCANIHALLPGKIPEEDRNNPASTTNPMPKKKKRNQLQSKIPSQQSLAKGDTFPVDDTYYKWR